MTMRSSSSTPAHRLIASWAAILCLLLAAETLRGTQVPRMSLEEVVDASESIVHGTVVRTWSAWDDDRKYIWTHYEVEIVDDLKGAVSGALVVSEPGGTVGETVLQVAGAPRYEVGDEVVLFAQRTPLGYLRTCGWGQGKFRVERAGKGAEATVHGGTKGVQLVNRPAARLSTTRDRTPLAAVHGLDLEQFKTRVREMVAKRSAAGDGGN